MSQQVKAKFVRVATKPGCIMMKVIVDGKEQWADCANPVYEFAKKSFQEGQDITLTADYANNRYNVSRIEAGSGSSSSPSSSGSSLAPANKPAASSSNYSPSSTGKSYGKSPEESERITRLSVLSSVCTLLGAIPGQVEVNAVGDVAEELYNRFLGKVKA